MPATHPYISSSGSVVKVINHLRKSFPSAIDAETIKKLGYAPQNESYVINILRFLGLIDDEGKKIDSAAKGFLIHQDSDFQKNFSALIKAAYKDLFALHADDTWKLSAEQLITFFRQSDDSSDVVGQRQAKTFQTLCALAGHAEIPKVKEATTKSTKATENSKSAKAAKKLAKSGSAMPPTPAIPPIETSRVGLTVRVEINLPSDGNQQTYDQIFQSIRKNLIDGK
jgi:hypothetical protein